MPAGCRGSQKEHYHCYSLDAVQFEGTKYADLKTPDSILMSEEYNRELQEVLRSLTEIQKKLIYELIYGLSINEIAKREGVSPNAVMKSVKYIREKLKNFFEFNGV